jgi:hypothetical protein
MRLCRVKEAIARYESCRADARRFKKRKTKKK